MIKKQPDLYNIILQQFSCFLEYRDLGLKEEGSYYLGEKEEGRSNASHEVKTAII
ncbi:hypothetical protein [Dapis sp. BLCC M172]|uniref:hypothetical protein n=1 Tax=Dapis sp. BLCC M172 TaxID=2975281 RepID=UPI003CF84BD2